MKFQVGDKVEVISEDCGTPKGSVLTVKRGPEGPVDGGNYYFEETHQIVLGKDLTLHKLTKNQRITALEKEVAELKIIVEDLRERKAIDKTVEVEEVNEPVEDFPIDLPYEPTPNQQRAEIIEKAKKFVEELFLDGNHGVGKVVLGHFYGGHNTVEFVVNEHKRTVVALLRPAYVGRNVDKGIAKCHPNNVFNEHIGKAIALGRALGLDVSEFEQAVQPSEVVVGMVVKGNQEDGYYRKSRQFTLTSKRASGAFHYSEATEYSGEDSDDFIFDNQIGEIINDTHAIYGEVE